MQYLHMTERKSLKHHEKERGDVLLILTRRKKAKLEHYYNHEPLLEAIVQG